MRYEWTEVMLLGNHENQDTTQKLFAAGSDPEKAYIANTLYRDPTFSNYASQAIPPIHIVVRNSSVLLTGVVNSEVERRKAETIVRNIPGILGVQNALRIEP